jgi:hypothetical protein
MGLRLCPGKTCPLLLPPVRPIADVPELFMTLQRQLSCILATLHFGAEL